MKQEDNVVDMFGKTRKLDDSVSFSEYLSKLTHRELMTRRNDIYVEIKAAKKVLSALEDLDPERIWPVLDDAFGGVVRYIDEITKITDRYQREMFQRMKVEIEAYNKDPERLIDGEYLGVDEERERILDEKCR